MRHFGNHRKHVKTEGRISFAPQYTLRNAGPIRRAHIPAVASLVGW